MYYQSRSSTFVLALVFGCTIVCSVCATSPATTTEGSESAASEEESVVEVVDDEDEQQLNETIQSVLKRQAIPGMNTDRLQLTIYLRRGTGTSYVRWGHTKCDTRTSEVVYQGRAAGQYFNHKGGASNYICLPEKPEYSRYLNTNQGNWIYGAEYEDYNNGLFPNRMWHKNVPCVRCYVPRRSTTIMLPARRNCPTYWTKEYEGYLMSGHYNQNAAYNYVCVDKDPQAVPGMDANLNGALFYFVQTQCTYLGNCPPYKNSAELTCVVCTR